MPAESLSHDAADSRVSYTVPRRGIVHSVELEIKKSRFLALLTRVDTEAEAREFISRVAAEHRDARHHCSAFVLGPTRATTRSSDDGEPAGTAGMPMLQALTAHVTTRQRTADEAGDLSDVCAVVVRWFGGVKLGAGGLVRAYSGAVTAALDTARLVRRMRCRELTLPLPYAEAGRVESQMRARGFTVLPTGYGSADATLRLLVADLPGAIDDARAALASITAGHASVHEGPARWEDVPDM
ncbi:MULTISPECIES: YigZ family protein [Kocuria]|uniref:IMPACT family protein n=1 Tax=Kocuria TaxID=57493 RepID=UPI00103E592C|nr:MULTISPECIES: YigZ family protein [Kocuria]MDT0119902.1 YigZ family protein [Kocuria sp. PD6]QBJ21440.1 YigZ family protein [Kocuria indica]